jgi:hypothetical protein
MILLVPTAFEWFEEWQEEPQGKRGTDYEKVKNTFIEASMSVVMKLFPHLEGKVGIAYAAAAVVMTDLLVSFPWTGSKAQGS